MFDDFNIINNVNDYKLTISTNNKSLQFTFYKLNTYKKKKIGRVC